MSDWAKDLQNRWLVAIIILSVFLRVAVAFYLGDIVDAPPLLTDQRSYHALGARLISGHGFSFDRDWYPFTPANTPTAHWSFLYSLFVAAVYAVFGIHPLAVRLVQAVLGGILLPLMVYRVGSSLLQPDVSAPLNSVPLVGAALAAVYAYFILYAATLMTETFFIVALLWSLERTLALNIRPTPARALGLGLALGLAALLRQTILPWVVVVFIWLLWSGHQQQALRKTVASLLLSIGVIAVLILPFTIRNMRVYGQFLLLNSNAGYAMYSAQSPMQGTDFKEFEAAPVPQELVGLNEAQLDRELMRRGINFVLADPGRYLLLCLSRVRAYFEFWPLPQTTLLDNIGRVGSFGLFLPFMLYGLFLSVRATFESSRTFARFARTPAALALLFVLFYSGLHILTWSMPRYRLPVDAVVLPFAAWALMDLASWARLQWGIGTSDIRL